MDPAFWEPSDEVVAEMQGADLILMNGASYAKWAEKVSLPMNTRVDTSAGFAGVLLTEKGSVSHSHGDGVVHSHDGDCLPRPGSISTRPGNRRWRFTKPS